MLKSRAETENSSHQRLPLGLSAAERLQQLQQEALDDSSMRQSPASAASSSAGSSSTEWTQKYPYRKTGGVESVAIRRSNFLIEANRTAQNNSMMMNSNGNVGTEETERALTPVQK